MALFRKIVVNEKLFENKKQGEMRYAFVKINLAESREVF